MLLLQIFKIKQYQLKFLILMVLWQMILLVFLFLQVLVTILELNTQTETTELLQEPPIVILTLL